MKPLQRSSRSKEGYNWVILNRASLYCNWYGQLPLWHAPAGNHVRLRSSKQTSSPRWWIRPLWFHARGLGHHLWLTKNWSKRKTFPISIIRISNASHHTDLQRSYVAEWIFSRQTPNLSGWWCWGGGERNNWRDASVYMGYLLHKIYNSYLFFLRAVRRCWGILITLCPAGFPVTYFRKLHWNSPGFKADLSIRIYLQMRGKLAWVVFSLNHNLMYKYKLFNKSLWTFLVIN